MRPDKKIADELFNPIGPLGPFAVKIRIAYMFGIIDDDIYKDFIAISKIRNKFAHDLTVTTFDDESIATLVKNMSMYKRIKKRGDDATERIAKKDHANWRELVADEIESDVLLSVGDAYRQCIRFLIHYLSDYCESVKAHKEETNLERH